MKPSLAISFGALALASGLLAAPVPALAQWTRIAALPTTTVFSVWSNADTIVAGADSVTFISTNAGTGWHKSLRVAAGTVAVTSVLFLDHRLYAGTFGQGVFVSDDLGDHWQAFNQGLVGGFQDSQLDVNNLFIHGGAIYAATAGASVYERSLGAGQTWHLFGNVFEENQASDVTDLAAGGASGNRLFATVVANGDVVVRDPGDADWTQSFLNNVGLGPGNAGFGTTWSGSRFVVGSTIGVFSSPTGQSPWTFFDLGAGALHNGVFAQRGSQLFGAFARLTFEIFETSGDGGVTWQLLEVVPATFAYRIAAQGANLYAAQTNGLWVRSIATVGVADGDAADDAPGADLALALAGRQPVGDEVRVRFVMPEAGRAVIDVYDVRGRHVGERVDATLAAGPQRLALDAGSLAPGVYVARLTAAGRHATVRMVHMHG